MTNFILGALVMFTVIAFIVVIRDYRRYLRDEAAYKRYMARQSHRHPANGPWDNSRWSA